MSNPLPEFLPLLREYIAKQEALCTALKERFPLKGDPLLLDLPRIGNVSLEDSFWEFQKHGSGVRFTQIPDGQIVDVPVAIVTHPRGIDAWRLLEYLESREVEVLQYAGHEHPVSEERSIEQLLQQLQHEGFLRIVNREKGIYEIIQLVGSVS